MHRGYYPLVDNQPMNGGQGFRRTRTAAPEPAADGRPPDTRHPMDRADRAPREDLPAADAGVGGLVGRHAAAEARRTLGDLRLSARQGTDLRGDDRHRGSEAAGHLRHGDALHDRADR